MKNMCMFGTGAPVCVCFTLTELKLTVGMLQRRAFQPFLFFHTAFKSMLAGVEVGLGPVLGRLEECMRFGPYLYFKIL